MAAFWMDFNHEKLPRTPPWMLCEIYYSFGASASGGRETIDVGPPTPNPPQGTNRQCLVPDLARRSSDTSVIRLKANFLQEDDERGSTGHDHLQMIRKV